MLAPGLGVSCDVPTGLVAHADANLLGQILRNLLGNAIKYNVEGGWIRIAAAAQDGGVAVTISNPSAGVAEDERERLFERFYRADSAHGRRIDGVGLGLALSRELARAHGGDLTLEVDAANVVHLRMRLPGRDAVPS